MSLIERARRVPRWRPGDSMVLVLLGLLLFAWAPLTYPGYFQVHSGFLPVYYLNDLWAHASWGWLPLLDRAPDFWRGEGPLPYLLAWFGRPLGAPVAIKTVFALALVTGPLALYAALRRRAGQAGALVAAVLYAYLPFSLTSVYVRGALAESVMLALAPLLFLSAAEQNGRGRFLRPVVTALLAAAAIWTQAGLGVLVILSVLAALLATEAAGAAAPALLAGGLLGLVTRLAWHAGTAPAALDFAGQRVYLFQLFEAGLGYGLSQPGWQDDLSFQVGLLSLGLAALHLFPQAADMAPAPRLTRMALAWAGLALFWILAALLPLPLGGLLTYPWQVLGLAGLGLCIVAGTALTRQPALAAAPWPAVLVVLAVAGGYVLLVPRYTLFQPAAAPVADFRGPQDEIMLLDAQTSGRLAAGQVVSTTLTWQALQVPTFDYNLFLHVLDEGGRRWGQADVQPLSDHPMTAWAPGAIVTGTVRVSVSPDVAPGTPLHVALGLYNWQSGARLVSGQADSVVLPPAGPPRGAP